MEKKITLRKSFLGLIVCLIFLLALPVHSQASENVEFKVSGVNENIKVYSLDGKEIAPINAENKQFIVVPGTYKYESDSGAGGFFYVNEKTSEVKLSTVDFKGVSPRKQVGSKILYLPDLGELHVYDESGSYEYCSKKDDIYEYLIPQLNGDAYYKFTYTPNDQSSNLNTEGHFYVYTEKTSFDGLNLSDSGFIPTISNKFATVKVPKDAEVLTYWELKFYTAKNWQTYTAYKSDEKYDYYEIPTYYLGSGNSGILVRQEGKVSRYGMVGKWNTDKTEFTMDELLDDSNQVNEGIGTYYASMLNNLPQGSEVDLKVGEYFDLVPLRAWQAISNSASNEHSDPEWHYAVVGGSDSIVSVDITEDDKIGQFGRIKANGTGTALVAFWYDAMEAPNDANEPAYLWSALWPELTGIAVVHVTDANATEPATTINSNIEVTEGKTIYYLRNQTMEDGTTVRVDDAAEYTFQPTATTNGNDTKITSVRVHAPIMAENGKLTYNISDWLNDKKSWQTYKQNADGTYTISLVEGKNIVEIKAGDAVAYHVICARGMDVQIDNVYNPGQKLACNDTAKITMKRLIPPVFKMGAIYNPSGITFHYKDNDLDKEMSFGQYMGGGSTSYLIRLTAEDEGTVQISGGYLSVAGWGATGDAHKNLTRNSMPGYGWSGGDNPNLDYGKLAYIPSFTFDVENNDDAEEVEQRNSGLLKALAVECKNANNSESVLKGSGMLSVERNIDQNEMAMATMSFLNSSTATINVGVSALKENSKLYARYWFGNDRENSELIELKNSDIVESTNSHGGKSYRIATEAITKAQNLKTNIYINVEIIVVPDEGYPMVYSRVMGNPRALLKMQIPLKNLEIHSANGSGTLGRFDGILEADDYEYTDATGNTVVQDMGYGFIATENHFTTEVPNETDKIYLSAERMTAIQGTACSIKVDGDKNVYGIGDEIPLNEGKNQLTVEYTAKNGKNNCQPRIYTIDVIRRSAAKQTTFEIPDGASVLVMQGSKVMKANEDGTYTLENGTYTYHVSMSGYLTKTDNFEVTDEKPNKVIKVMDLDPVPEQSGTVSVQLAGQSTVFCPTRDVEIQQTAEDLAANRYVQYNHGGYTVLHALLDAAKASGMEFECYRGKFVLVDNSITENNGKKAGWVCKVNGIECSDPANTLVNADDKIDLFYNSGWSGMLHARLTPENGEVTRGDSIILTLNGTAVHATDAEAATIAGADIYDGETRIGTTDENGEVAIDSNTLLLGTHRFTAVKKDENDHNILTATMSTINVKKPDNASADPTKTEVTFRLIGDTKHNIQGSDSQVAHAYTTWIATGTYTFDGDNVTVGQVFEAALKEAGLSYEGLEKNYISAITAPESCGGYELREKDNGQNSGWMYTVNGVHPSMGMNDWYVSTGDEIIWHYIDDYKTEQADMKNDDGSYGSAGNASTWNKWLEAADETPGAREKAAEVTDKINQIGKTIELTDECEAKITAAREAYEELSREEKGYVTNYDTLTAKETELARLKKEAADKAAAAEVTEKINNLPDVKNLTLEKQDVVVAARTAYGSLTDDQKEYVEKETYATLVLAEEQIAKLLEAAAVDQLIEEIEALPSKENVTLENETAIATALAHYNALSEDQKNDLEEKSQDSLTKLNDVIDRLNELKEEAAEQAAVDEVNAKLNALPAAEDILFADQTAVTEARNAYEALEDIKGGLKDRVSVEALAKLTAAEDRLDALQKEVDHVAELIEAIPAVDNLTAADADQIQEARDAYDALNNDQKQQLTDSGLLSELLIAENQMSWLQKDAQVAKKVTDRINSLPAVKDLRLSDKTAVEAARYAYDNLSDEQKQYVSEDTLKELEEREAEIKRLEEVTPNPTPTPTPDPNPSDDPKQDEDEDSITLTYQNYPISVTGKLSGYELRLTALKADDDVVKQMQNMISSKEALIRLYDVALYKDGKEVEWNDKLTVNFQVGTSYNGQTLSVLHEVNGKLETLSGTVSNGILSVTANGTGSFGVVVPASTVSTGNGSSNNNGSTGTFTNGNLSGGSTGTGNGTTAVSGTGKVTSAKTGDDTDILFPIAGLITATGVLAGVVLYYKKKKRITGVQTEEE